MPREYDFVSTNGQIENKFQNQKITFKIDSPGNKLLPVPSSFDITLNNCLHGFGLVGLSLFFEIFSILELSEIVSRTFEF